MDDQVKSDEVRIVIRNPSSTKGGDAGLIPAKVFKGMFNSVLAALKAADKDLHGKKAESLFLVSHLRVGSSEFGILERQPAGGISPSVDLFKRATQAVYRSEFAAVAEHPNLAKHIAALGKKIDDKYAIVAQFADGDEVPLDTFFSNQARRLLESDGTTETRPSFFAGNAFGSFDGRLGNIDYRGAAWIGHLVMQSSDVQIECVFDKSQGEDAYNRFGNKRVSITGRAIYTGDSQLPERIEVVSIEEIAPAESYREIRGSLVRFDYDGFDVGN